MVEWLYKQEKRFGAATLAFGWDKSATKLITQYYQRIRNEQSGLHQGQRRDKQIIVSLTTFPGRINQVWVSIEAMMRQTYKPDRIILWLAKEELPEGAELPESLKYLQRKGLEICYCEENLKPYNKLYYSLQMFPEDIIITVDDDVIYTEKLIETLMNGWRIYPESIICMRSHEMRIGYTGNLFPYRRWNLYECREEISEKPSFQNFFTGVGGVLYPPHCFDETVFDKNLIKELSPLNDDVWFNAMARKKKTRIVNVRNNQRFLFVIPETQTQALSIANCAEDWNDVYLKQVSEYFGMTGSDWISAKGGK